MLSTGINQWLPKVKADACTECGVCESRCPQKIQIRAQLKEAHENCYAAKDDMRNNLQSLKIINLCKAHSVR